MRAPTANDAHVRAHDDLLVRVATCGQSIADFVAHCRGDYRPSVYPDLSGSRLADVLDAAFIAAGRKTRCYRGQPMPGRVVAERDAWIESEVQRLAGTGAVRRAA